MTRAAAVPRAGVLDEVDLADAEIVCRPPIGIDEFEFLGASAAGNSVGLTVITPKT